MPFVGTTFLKAAQFAFVKGGIGKLAIRKLNSAWQLNCTNGSTILLYEILLLTPVAGLIFETKNREIFLERFFWRVFSGAALRRSQD